MGNMQKEKQNYTLKIEEKDAAILKQRNEIDNNNRKNNEVIAEEEYINSKELFNEKLQSSMQEEKQNFITKIEEKDAQILKQKNEIDIGMKLYMNKLNIIAEKDKNFKNLEEDI